MARRLRSGYTTGACAAAAAKAAVLCLLTEISQEKVEIPFPDGSRVWFAVHRSSFNRSADERVKSSASVIKDAGDDPDVTNGAEIVAHSRFVKNNIVPGRCIILDEQRRMRLCPGEGVGMVTKPGLAVKPGEPAINPVPREMIKQATQEAIDTIPTGQILEITIAVPDGEILAQKTLNHRLGIVGGLSILGTTGIVRPVSADAWTATIKASLAVAKEAGLEEVVLSTGRTSEMAIQNMLNLPEEAYAMMGDYLEFSLKEAAKLNFKIIHLSGMWAKLLKAAMHVPQTHVRHGALEVQQAIDFIAKLIGSGAVIKSLEGSNTAREIYERLAASGQEDIIKEVCEKAKVFAEQITGSIPVTVYLVDNKRKVVTHV